MERTDANIFTLVEWLMLMMQMGDSPIAADIDIRDKNAVNILTVHSSKGLEFKVVFLVNLVSDRFPSRERSEKFLFPKVLLKKRQRKIGIFIWKKKEGFLCWHDQSPRYIIFYLLGLLRDGETPQKAFAFRLGSSPKFKSREREKSADTTALFNRGAFGL